MDSEKKPNKAEKGRPEADETPENVETSPSQETGKGESTLQTENIQEPDSNTRGNHPSEQAANPLERLEKLSKDKKSPDADEDYSARYIIYNIFDNSQHNAVYGSAQNVGGSNNRVDYTNGAGQTPANDAKKSDKNDLPSFLHHANSREISALIVLATLERIPVDAFFPALDALCEYMPAQEKKDDDGNSSPYLETAEELLSPFPIVRKRLSSDSGLHVSGIQDMALIEFEDEDFAGYVRVRIWNEYFKYRMNLLEWLSALRMKTDSVVNRIVSYLAMRGLANYAALDMGYASRDLIPYLERNFQMQRDVKYLVEFFRNLMRIPECGDTADRLLLRWSGRFSGIFWQTPYRLYGEEGEWKFQEVTRNTLLRQLQADFDGRPTLDSLRSLEQMLKWLSKDRSYFLSPAHENATVAELLCEQIAILFMAQRKQNDRYAVAELFLMLFRWDYLTGNDESPRLVFLNGFRRKSIRENLLPLFRFIWRYSDLRSVIKQVLTAHFSEIALRDASYSYLERPFLYLAFTGDRNDYYSTVYLLRECAKDGDAKPVAAHLEQYLSDYLKSRKG